MDEAPRSVTAPLEEEGLTTEAEDRTRQLRSDIERTREDMAETVEAIGQKLRPGNVVAQAASATSEKVKDVSSIATGVARDMWRSRGGPQLAERVRRNPMGAILVGVAVTWLMFGRRRRSRRR
jgi:hypothetical protein